MLTQDRRPNTNRSDRRRSANCSRSIAILKLNWPTSNNRLLELQEQEIGEADSGRSLGSPRHSSVAIKDLNLTELSRHAEPQKPDRCGRAINREVAARDGVRPPSRHEACAVGRIE